MDDTAVPLSFVDVRGPSGAHQDVPVVLIHGWASGSAYWEPLAALLLDAGWPVWILDLAGYHPGDRLQKDFTWTLETAAAGVAAVIRARSDGPVHLVGHSMGGSVALTVAAANPGLVATVALVGMVPAPPNDAFRAMLQSQLAQGFIDDQTKAKCMKAWYGNLTGQDMETLSKGFDVPFEVLGPSGEAAMTGVEPSVPGRVHAPLLVLAGVGDRVRSIDQMEAFVAAAPERRRFHAVPDAGHSVHWEQPEACAKALDEFWRTSWPPPA
ncbi:alpha/beta hydrolase [Paenarthrobacter sp. NPDC089322]|uniref:alpha/beta fold hydrolase n=1 Tax=Paenarthrobacter sp. NPDC089322 TaxID=3155065 RepID=UPI00342725CC